MSGYIHDVEPQLDFMMESMSHLAFIHFKVHEFQSPLVRKKNTPPPTSAPVSLRLSVRLNAQHRSLSVTTTTSFTQTQSKATENNHLPSTAKMPTFKGQCYCSSLTYTLTLSNPSGDARTSLCHCGNCKKFTGGPFGITTKISRSAFKYVHGAGEDEKAEGSGSTEDGGPGGGAVRGKEEGDGKEEKVLKVHEADNGSGVVLRREFCGRCGSGILEFGANAGDFIYIFYGTLDHEGRKALAPKGEFFTKYREVWMPEVPGLFQKQEIKQ